MDRIATQPNAPDLFGASKPGFIDKNASTGTAGTPISAAWLNGVQEELVRLIEAAELVPNAGNLGQLATVVALRTQVGTFTRAQRYAAAVLTDQASIDWNLDTQPVARVTLAGNRTMNAPSNQRDPGFFALIVNQDATGGRTLAWNVAYDFGADGVPALPSGANKVAIFTFMSNGASMRCVGRWSN